jgi:hypothetical protein
MPDIDSFAFLSYQIDHIRSLKHRGTNGIDNLVYACFYCNSGKGSDLGSINDLTGEFSYFFNPRTDAWNEHFALLDDYRIEPITATGWVTATVFEFNTPERIEARRLIF